MKRQAKDAAILYKVSRRKVQQLAKKYLDYMKTGFMSHLATSVAVGLIISS
jgi:hypothetical protein